MDYSHRYHIHLSLRISKGDRGSLHETDCSRKKNRICIVLSVRTSFQDPLLQPQPQRGTQLPPFFQGERRGGERSTDRAVGFENRCAAKSEAESAAVVE